MNLSGCIFTLFLLGRVGCTVPPVAKGGYRIAGKEQSEIDKKQVNAHPALLFDAGRAENVYSDVNEEKVTPDKRGDFRKDGHAHNDVEIEKVFTDFYKHEIITDRGDAIEEAKHAQSKLDKTKGKTCPEEETIAPCVCNYVVDGNGELDLDCSKITDEEQLGQVFENLPPDSHFESFFLNSNRNLKTLKSGIFQSITFTKILMIFNSLEEVEAGALDPSADTLTTIDMWGNSLIGFPFMDLSKFGSLEVLDLADNNIQGWPTDIDSATLTRLDLSGNPINVLPQDAFDQLSILQHLIMGNVNLSTITPESFSSLDQLETLDIRQNHLTDLIEGSLSFTSPNISHIYVHHNKLESMHPHAISTPNSVTGLHFESNEFTNLDEGIWRPWLEAGSRLTFNGNPIICDCGVAWLVLNQNLLDLVERPVLCGSLSFSEERRPHYLHHLNPDNYVNC